MGIESELDRSSFHGKDSGASFSLSLVLELEREEGRALKCHHLRKKYEE